MDKHYYGLLLFLILLSSVIKFTVSYNQLISPKSDDVNNNDLGSLETSMNSELFNERTATLEQLINDGTQVIVESSIKSTDSQPIPMITSDPIVEVTKYSRVERAASPIINEASPSIGFQKLSDYEDNDIVASNVAGRYGNFDISPTRTNANGFNNINGLTTDFSSSHRTSKNIDGNSFLVKRGPRLESASGPLQSTMKSNNRNVTRMGLNANDPRQNPNPDIQDIITGIVKLLNGNVNVHANTQTSRRPIPSRINNRGPPRISESQPLPLDYDLPHTSTNRPPPYPFERPEGPVRPFLTGVPIPEQIVPSMQQNYRPGFISQNRPPWQRPRPRPPFGNLRPPLPYKPLPPQPDYGPQDEDVPIVTDVEPTPDQQINDDITTTSTTTEGNQDFHLNHDSHNYYVEEIEDDQDGDNDDETIKEKDDDTNKPNSPSDIYTNHNNNKKKDEYTKKKEKQPIKISEKKPINQPTPTASAPNEIEPSEIEKEVQQTTVETVSEVNNAYDENQTPLTPTAVESSIVETVDSLKPTTIVETPNLPIIASVEQTTTTPLVTNLIEVTEVITTTTTSTTTKITFSNNQTMVNSQYHPRPGIVLDDPEFKPGGLNRPQPPRIAPQIKPTRPPGYGEIFDVTLSAIQGPGSGGGNKQVINIKPYGYPSGNGAQSDIIVSPNGDDGFVSIDGKRTYINLFGEQTDSPIIPENIQPTATFTNNKNSHQTQLIPPGVTGTGYAVAETETPPQQSPKPNRPIHYRPQQQQPPIRIDTCIVGDDSTCDQAQNEKCKTDLGVSSCHCRPGYSRRKHREPCRKIVSIVMSLRVDKIYDRRIVWDKQLSNIESEPYTQLSYESIRAVDSAMSMTPFSDEFIKAKVNRIYQGEATQGSAGVFVNLTLLLEENLETLRPSLKNDVQRHLLGVIHRRNNNIGNSALYVESPPGAISRLQDLDECTSSDLNDCHPDAICSNVWGSFRCECQVGFKDPWQDQPTRSGRECQSCPESYCNNRGTCSYELSGSQTCSCIGSYYGSQCEIDGEVLGVAIGASVAAVIIIILTLICLVMWSRRWHREQKNAIGSPVFGYMTAAPMKTGSLNHQGPYQITLEDRMRWAQIADVMAQANHYAAEPINPSRPSSTMFGYPTLQAIGNMNTLANMSNLGTISMAGTLPMHNGTLPPVPLPRLNIHSRSNGMRTLENSSSSEEEDRTDLLGRNFHVPRPKSRSNGSITNQSGIYYDVDYEPSGGGCNDNIYGVTMQTNTVPGPQGIPMSTYTAGKAPSSYYMK